MEQVPRSASKDSSASGRAVFLFLVYLPSSVSMPTNFAKGIAVSVMYSPWPNALLLRSRRWCRLLLFLPQDLFQDVSQRVLLLLLILAVAGGGGILLLLLSFVVKSVWRYAVST